MSTEPAHGDAYRAAEIARLIESAGMVKAALPAAQLFAFALLAAPAWGADPAAWHPDAAALCLQPPYDAATTAAQRDALDLIETIEAMAPGPDPLLDILRRNGTALCLEDRPGPARGYFEVGSNLIALNADLDIGQRLLILAHELRHLDQYGRGFCPGIDYDLREMERFTYMVEADAQAIATFYAWQLAGAGRPEAWDAVRAMPEYADVAAAFEAAIAAGEGPEVAVSRAFDRWFASPWRIESYRLSACTAYLDRLDATKRLQRYDRLPENYFDALCRLTDGTPYRCEVPEPAR